MDLIRSSADLLVLSVLAEEPLYGYAIAKRVEARSEGRIRLPAGVLYPLLHDLEAKGLLRSEWDQVVAEGSSGKGRQRKWYRLSAKGRRRLTQRARAHRAYQAAIESFLPSEEGA